MENHQHNSEHFRLFVLSVGIPSDATTTRNIISIAKPSSRLFNLLSIPHSAQQVGSIGALAFRLFTLVLCLPICPASILGGHYAERKGCLL